MATCCSCRARCPTCPRSAPARAPPGPGSEHAAAPRSCLRAVEAERAKDVCPAGRAAGGCSPATITTCMLGRADASALAAAPREQRAAGAGVRRARRGPPGRGRARAAAGAAVLPPGGQPLLPPGLQRARRVRHHQPPALSGAARSHCWRGRRAAAQEPRGARLPVLPAPALAAAAPRGSRAGGAAAARTRSGATAG